MTAKPWVWCGSRRLTVDAPCRLVPPPRIGASLDPDSAVRAALASPVNSPRLSQIAGETLAALSSESAAPSIALVVPDPSRALPLSQILESILEELARGGVADEHVTIYVGCGLHRALSQRERIDLVGERIARRTKVVDAHGIDSSHTSLGRTSLGCPASIADGVAAADLTVTVGVVEPHLYAGFSGGVKGVAIGCAGQETIAWTHYPAFITRPGVQLAHLDGNPFQQTLREIAARTSLRFALNCVMDHGGGIAGVAAGDPAAVQEQLAAEFCPFWLHQVDEPYDVVVAGIAAPKDENLYQATRAATYIGLAARPALRDGGLIVLAAALPEGVGGGPGEMNFGRVLSEATAPDDIVRRGLREPLGPGGQRAFVVARVLQRFRLAIWNADDPSALAPFRHLGISCVESLPQALAAQPAGSRQPRVLAVADAMATLVHG